MENAASPPPNYTVVARRYRPKSFSELIGQDHIAQALGKAISTGRVGHAYLFTGARGVGKTSTARIFAKSLNVSEGEELAPDIANAIDAGEDMDVIEIDGASNRGIEEIRQLRANVNVRPSRARFKIYIIDEVHMLTNQAFNALLKTLEEPPSHVKFIFCTTDPDKIPITVLSRCQRFDFAPVKFEAIQLRLKEISQAEGYEVEADALALLARRAAGSMRDSQSLLEQVMSFSTDRITTEQVHALLGTADESRLLALTETLCNCDALAAIALVDEATKAGSDPGQLAEQLLNYLRDLMTAGVDGGPELLKIANPLGHAKLATLAADWGIQTILTAIQILDESLVRMRTSVSATTLLEVALVQICQLEKLASIPALLEAVMQGSSGTLNRQAAGGAEKKNAEKIDDSTAAISPVTSISPATSMNTVSINTVHSPQAGVPKPHLDTTQPLGSPAKAGSNAPGIASGTRATEPSIEANHESVNPALQTSASAPQSSAADSHEKASAPPLVSEASSSLQHAPSRPVSSPVSASSDSLLDWQKSLANIDSMLADFAAMAVAVEPQGSDRWNVLFPPGSSKPCEYCEQPQRRAELQAALEHTLGRTVQLSFTVMPGEVHKPAMATPQAAIRAQKIREMAEHPFIKQFCEILDGEIIRVDPPRERTLSEAAATNKSVS